jgi:hypothetical protein
MLIKNNFYIGGRFFLKSAVQTTVQSTGYCIEVFIRGYPAAKGPVG